MARTGEGKRLKKERKMENNENGKKGNG